MALAAAHWLVLGALWVHAFAAGEGRTAAAAAAGLASGTGLGAEVSAAPAPAPVPAPVGAPGPAAAACPGTPACSGHGGCDSARGFCWCDPGFAGLDCSEEAPLYVNVTAIGPHDLQEAVGRYKVDRMYLSETCGRDGSVKFIHWEETTSGWVISEFGSPCPDDVCFFGYQQKRDLPPTNGYVYGAPDFQVYVDRLVYDDADKDTRIRRGYHLQVEYTPDPHVEGVPDLTALNGRYVLQPMYVHEATGKYAILPVDFNSERTWVLSGMVGVPRKWRVLEKGFGATYDMYHPPTTEGNKFWEPLEYGLQVVATCADHLPAPSCSQLVTQCGIAEPAMQWVRECCRATCGECGLSRTACDLVQATSFLALQGGSRPLLSRGPRLRRAGRAGRIAVELAR